MALSISMEFDTKIAIDDTHWADRPSLRLVLDSGVDYERSINGLMSFTPDGFPLLGETAEGRLIRAARRPCRAAKSSVRPSRRSNPAAAWRC